MHSGLSVILEVVEYNVATTLKDVADQIGVSKTLVSRVLNNKPDVRVSQAIRRRIVETALEMNYRPSVIARALVCGRTHQLAISSADSDWQIGGRDRLAEVVGFVQGAAKRQYRVLIIASPEKQTDPHELDILIHSCACDGFCIYAEQAGPTLYNVLESNGTPFVVVGNPGDPKLPQVDQDNYRYAYHSVLWLREQGHVRIAFNYPMSECQNHIKELRRGYQAAMERFCGGFDPEMIPQSYPDLDERRRILQRPNPPTAVIVDGVNTLMDWKETVRAIGLRYPDDVAILVHLDPLEISYLRAGDAYHLHDPGIVGATAAEVLMRWIEERRPPGRVLIPTAGPKWFDPSNRSPSYSLSSEAPLAR